MNQNLATILYSPSKSGLYFSIPINQLINGFIISIPFRKLHGFYLQTISSERNSCSGVVVPRSRREETVKVKIITISAILAFIRILYLKQESNILCCFCILKFEEGFYCYQCCIWTQNDSIQTLWVPKKCPQKMI